MLGNLRGWPDLTLKIFKRFLGLKKILEGHTFCGGLLWGKLPLWYLVTCEDGQIWHFDGQISHQKNNLHFCLWKSHHWIESFCNSLGRLIFSWSHILIHSFVWDIQWLCLGHGNFPFIITHFEGVCMAVVEVRSPIFENQLCNDNFRSQLFCKPFCLFFKLGARLMNYSI